MKQIANIGISIFGIYLVVKSIAGQTYSSFSLSINATLSDYLWAFGPSIIFFLGGLFCLLYRQSISSWIINFDESQLFTEIDVDKIERVFISLLGLFFLLETIPSISIPLIHYFFSEEIKATENITAPLRDYAVVQASAVIIVIVISGMMTFFPQKIQSILHKTRSF